VVRTYEEYQIAAMKAELSKGLEEKEEIPLAKKMQKDRYIHFG